MSKVLEDARAHGARGVATYARAHDQRRISSWWGLALVALSVSCVRSASVALEPPRPTLTLAQPALFPETIVYHAKRQRFIVGSFRKGAIFEVDDQGELTLMVDDPRLCSVLGIALDEERNRLWVANSDLASSTKPSQAGPKQLAAVGVYDLATGSPLHYVDLSSLSAGNRLLNGIALDNAGNAYVTDSFAQSIYKVDVDGRASVFLGDPAFAGEGINLNGLVVHPDGYLLVIKKSDGALFKVPLAAPTHFAKVATPRPFIGGDGLILVGKGELVVVANQTPSAASNAVFALTSSDDWASARLRSTEQLGEVYPTTGVVREGTLYVVHSKLNELIQAPPADKSSLQTRAVIEQIGQVRR